jgi:hypothetical protein
MSDAVRLAVAGSVSAVPTTAGSLEKVREVEQLPPEPSFELNVFRAPADVPSWARIELVDQVELPCQ